MHPFIAASVATALIHDRVQASARASSREVRPAVEPPRLA
jgi:hypothetical protein